ncbi:retrotransposon gag protein [Cucumis melo var. makuwa]|uniref:Retrotransposon gag protein n=1 Tax=Cucumis melo var. makuwa TaxID=1194695 RepID=A0A5A7VSY7_CUCMM|nr:retrotransposon gag protein [Cucumis melo var. makuwa]TYK21099.1 retrotransposon gag protein [Cucumis melo var. makuwa]
MQEQEQSSVLTKKSWEQLMESSKGGIILKENHLLNNFTSASDLFEKESHFEVLSVMMADVTVEAAMTEMKRKINFLMTTIKEKVRHIRDMITSSITQYGGPPQTFFMYSKPYTKRINDLRMLIGYQPSKFQQFDGKGNPKI